MSDKPHLSYYRAAVPQADHTGRVRAGMLVAAIAGAILCLLGLVHSVRAAVAQALYYSARGLTGPDKTEAVLGIAERAHGLYRWNYGLAVLCADAAFLDSVASSGPEAHGLLGESQKWCERGLHLNSFDRRLVFRKMGILSVDEKTRPAAMELWRGYTDWNFWNPDNHYYMGMMYVMSGELDKARESARWARDSVYYARLIRAMEDKDAGARKE